MNKKPMPLKLSRALCAFDVETTGTNAASDRIVELAIMLLQPDGIVSEWHSLINPTLPIHSAASKIHGITDEMVAKSPTFASVARTVAAFIGDADLTGFNVLRFDIAVLEAEFGRAQVPFKVEGRDVVDSMELFHRFEPRDLTGAVNFYCGREHVGAHSALADVQASIDVLVSQVERYKLPCDITSLAKLCVDPDSVDRDGKFRRVDGDVVFTFGKHKGRRLVDVARTDPGFLNWMLRSDFSTSTKRVAEEALARRNDVGDIEPGYAQDSSLRWDGQ